MNAKEPEEKMSDQTTSEQTNPEQNAPEPANYNLDKDLDKAGDKSYSQGLLVWRRSLHHKGTMVANAILILVILLAFTSTGVGSPPGWRPKNRVDLYAFPQGSSNGEPTLRFWLLALGEHPFGWGTIGKGYLALVMQGTQKSVIIAFMVGLIVTMIETLIDGAAGYFRDRIESILMRATDLVIITPLLVLAAVLGRMVDGVNIYVLAGVLGVVVWTGMARLMRGKVLSLREREFIHAAKAIGTPNWRIILRHILPNYIGTIVVNSTLLITSAILLEAALSYPGFGVWVPESSLGLLIPQNQEAMDTRPWLFWWPGLFILTITLCVNFIGDGLRDAFDPRQQMD